MVCESFNQMHSNNDVEDSTIILIQHNINTEVPLKKIGHRSRNTGTTLLL